MRTATLTRNTKETQITLTFYADGGPIAIETGLPFFDHMLNAFACHGRFGLEVDARGDIEVDPHHLIEDTGIVLGQAIREALPEFKGIQRAGCFAFPMDGTLAVVALDLCGRPNLVWKVELGHFPLGGLDPNLFREFYKGLVDGLRGTLHVHIPCKDNDHHLIEAIFKAFGRALREAAIPVASGAILSTKGMLDT
ncbi:MAG TPA: imidazoleglycerol-phosphate dehydratase [Coleofasciculaceae cyanobacterium]|jgi:imidazoleglycerol-phosphate dehydratase